MNQAIRDVKTLFPRPHIKSVMSRLLYYYKLRPDDLKYFADPLNMIPDRIRDMLDDRICLRIEAVYNRVNYCSLHYHALMYLSYKYFDRLYTRGIRCKQMYKAIKDIVSIFSDKDIRLFVKRCLHKHNLTPDDLERFTDPVNQIPEQIKDILDYQISTMLQQYDESYQAGRDPIVIEDWTLYYHALLHVSYNYYLDERK